MLLDRWLAFIELQYFLQLKFIYHNPTIPVLKNVDSFRQNQVVQLP